MHYKKYILPLLAIATLMVTGCHQNVAEDAIVGGDCTKEQLVTIRTYIHNGVPFLRAGETTWHPQSVDALPFEEAIYNAVLYVYRGTTLEKSMIYYTGAYGVADPSLSALGEERARAITPAVVNGAMELSMDIELLPGNYNFIVVVNSKEAIAQAKASTDGIAGVDPSTIVYTGEATKAFTSYDIDPEMNGGLGNLPRVMLPMVGEQSLRVPNIATTSTVRHELMPKIALERVHARLEVTLEIPEPREGTPFFPDQYRLWSVGLYGIGGYDFPLLPQDGEQTAIDKSILLHSGVSAPTDPASLVNHLGLLTTDSDFESVGLNKQDGGLNVPSFLPLLYKPSAEGQSLNNAPYPHAANREDIKGVYVYLPPLYRTGTDEPAFVPHIELVFRPVGSSYLDPDTGEHLPLPLAGEDAVYKVKLHNEKHKQEASGAFTELTKLPDDFWSIRRNTIYRLPLLFTGKEFKINDYEVVEWENQVVDVPW